jgi:hypothetical protein
VPGGKTSLWTVEMLYDHFGEMYLPTGWKKFERVHQIKAKHFLVFNYDGEAMLNVSVFDKATTTRTPTLIMSSRVGEEEKKTMCLLVIYIYYRNLLCNLLVMIKCNENFH